MKEKNKNQIIRFDGKNVFLEVMNTAFGIGKVQINFIEYDASKEKNSRQLKNIPIYIDMSKFLVLAQDILSGKIAQLSRMAQEQKAKGGYKYCKEVYIDMGGISAKNLKIRNQERADKKSLSRHFKITPGDSMPWIFSADIASGEENSTGLIVRKGNVESVVRVPLSDEDIKKFAKIVESHINAYYTSQYVIEALEGKNSTDNANSSTKKVG